MLLLARGSRLRESILLVLATFAFGCNGIIGLGDGFEFRDAGAGAGGLGASGAGTGGSAGTPTAGTGGTAGVGGQAGDPGCQGVPLVDDFDDNYETQLWRLDFLDVVVRGTTGGELEVVVPAGVHQLTFDSTVALDANGGRVSIEVVKPPTPGTGVRMLFGFASSPVLHSSVYFEFDNGVIQGTNNRDGTSSTPAQRDLFDPVEHRFLQLRHDGSTMFWETSPDRMNWTVAGQLPSSQVMDLDRVLVRLFVIADPMATGDTIRVDDFRSNLCL